MWMTLLKRYKWITLAFLLGGTLATGTLTCVRRTNDTKLRESIQKLNDEAMVLRGEAQEATKDALAYKAKAEELEVALKASVVNSKKLEKELAKIKIPETGPAPTYIADIVLDLQKWGLNPLVGASNVVGRSAFGIKKDETQILWKFAADAQRVPALEFKIQKYSEVVASLGSDRDLAVKLAETKGLEAAEWQTASEKSKAGADKLQAEVAKMTKVLNSEKRKRWIYAGTAAVVAGLTAKQLSR